MGSVNYLTPFDLANLAKNFISNLILQFLRENHNNDNYRVNPGFLRIQSLYDFHDFSENDQIDNGFFR